MRVLFVSRGLHPVAGGGERAVAAAALARGLARLGARVLAVAPAGDPPEACGLARRLDPVRLDEPDGSVYVVVHEGRLADGRVEVVLPVTDDLNRLGRVAVAVATARGFLPAVVHLETDAAAAAGPLTAAGAPLVSAAELPGLPGIDEARWPRRPLPDREVERRRLLERLGLEVRARRPLIAALGPFLPDWLGDAGVRALATSAVTVFAIDPAGDGTAAPWVRGLVDRHEAVMASLVADDASVAALLAAADFALLPHRLPAPSDLHCLRSGVLPIAPADGGYGALLVEADARTATGSALLYHRDGDHDLARAIRRAAGLRAAGVLPRLGARAAALDLSWDTAARRALDVYARRRTPGS